MTPFTVSTLQAAEQNQDAYNLGWKLSFVLNGFASPALLQSYTEERQPVVNNIMHQAFSRYVNRVAEDKTIPHDKELPDIICELGYRYVRGALIPSSSVDASKAWEDPHHPGVIAGSRIPHVSLVDVSRNDEALSTLDLVRRTFVLIAVDQTSPWVDAAKSQRVPVDAYIICENSTPIRDLGGRFQELCKIEKGEAILIRPDGHIAWRGVVKNLDPDTTLKTVLKQVLCMF